MSCGYIRGEGRFQTTSPPATTFSGFPCRRVSFLSPLYCSHTRVTVYHSRGVIVFRLMVDACEPVQVRAYIGIEFGIEYMCVCVCVDRRIFHREGIRPRVAQYFSSNASRAFLLLNPAPCLTRRNEILRRDNADEFVIYNRSTYVHFIAPRFASFRFYGREFLRPLIDSPAETRVHAHASNRAV